MSLLSELVKPEWVTAYRDGYEHPSNAYMDHVGRLLADLRPTVAYGEWEPERPGNEASAAIEIDVLGHLGEFNGYLTVWWEPDGQWMCRFGASTVAVAGWVSPDTLAQVVRRRHRAHHKAK